MEITEVKQVREVRATLGGQDSRAATKTVNELLADGWVLLALHERAEFDGIGGQTKLTVYILGRKD